MLKGSVLITGGAGFLGRGILHRAQAENWPAQFVVYSRDQQKHEQVKAKYKNARCVIGDIHDTERLALLMSTCDLVVHAAALKHLPECEAQPSEAIRVNVDGTRSVLAAAVEAGVKRVVCISTDKAAAPMNTYGMTKALVERLVFESIDYPLRSGTELVGCRYGNVIGSTGSVWPVFCKQAQIGRRLQVTDPTMTRFFTPIGEAVDVVLTALTHQDAMGTVLIPQPKAMSIGRLAAHLTEEWHLHPYTVTGRRPGEKSDEIMLAHTEVRQVLKDRYYHLYGPTRQLTSEPAEFVGASSADADVLPPEEFIEYARASELI